MMGRMSGLLFDTLPLVQGIHASGKAFVLAVTGGGSEAIAELLSVPGASRSVLEALVPYCESALADFLGGPVDQFCSAATARAMAMAAYRRAQRHAAEHGNLLGVACTASLSSDRPKRGAHRLHAAWQSATTTCAVSIELVKGRRTRQQEEHLAAAVVLNLIAEAAGISDRLLTDLKPDEPIERAIKLAPPMWRDLLAGTLQHVGCLAQDAPSAGPAVVFPGAFNPLHAGHRAMAAVAGRLLGSWPIYEISILNAAKPPLDFFQIEQRVAQFDADENVCLTRAPTFAEKARLFPGATFIAGVDTIVRLVDPKYYGGSAAGAEQALASIADAGCRFLVFGRITDGRFLALEDLELPASFKALCRSVSEADFRSDISSTTLRHEGSP